MQTVNERMRVLDLLEAGKINAAEAADLLSVLSGPKFINKETRENMEEKLHNFTESCGRLAKELGAKLQVAYKNAEPKIKKASRTALKKTAEAVDSLACKLHESLDKAEEVKEGVDLDDDAPGDN